MVETKVYMLRTSCQRHHCSLVGIADCARSKGFVESALKPTPVVLMARMGVFLVLVVYLALVLKPMPKAVRLRFIITTLNTSA